MLQGHISRVPAARRFPRCDDSVGCFPFTVPTVIVWPLSALLVWKDSFDRSDRWLNVTYALYLLVGACWLKVAPIQDARRGNARRRDDHPLQ